MKTKLVVASIVCFGTLFWGKLHCQKKASEVCIDENIACEGEQVPAKSHADNLANSVSTMVSPSFLSTVPVNGNKEPNERCDNVNEAHVAESIESPPVNNSFICREDAKRIAMERYGDKYSALADKVEVLLDGNTYTVTIPSIPVEIPEGKRRRGPGFSVKVVVDAESGKVLQSIRGPS